MSDTRKRLRSYRAIEERQNKLPHVLLETPRCSFAAFHASMYSLLRLYLRDNEAVCLSQTQHCIYDVFLLHPYIMKHLIWLRGKKKSKLPISRLFTIERVGINSEYAFPESLCDSGIKSMVVHIWDRALPRLLWPSALVELTIALTSRLKLHWLPRSITRLTIDSIDEDILDYTFTDADHLPPRLTHLTLLVNCFDHTNLDQCLPASLRVFSWPVTKCSISDVTGRMREFWRRTGCNRINMTRINAAGVTAITDFTSVSSLIDFYTTNPTLYHYSTSRLTLAVIDDDDIKNREASLC
jgi:hypothetical protein